MISSPRTPVRRSGGRRLWRLLAGILGVLGIFAVGSVQNAQPAEAAGVQLIVTVAGADGSPAPKVGVTVADAGGKLLKATTGADGKATVNLTKSGKYGVYFDAATLPKGVGPAANPTIRATTGNISPQFTQISLAAGGATDAVTPSPMAAAPSSASASASSGAGSEKGDDQGSSRWAQVLPKVATGATFGLLLALASLGLSLIYSTTGLNNFSHGELVTFGAFMAYMVGAQIGANGWWAILVAAVAGGVFGYCQDLLLWRQLRKRRLGSMQIMIVSIGLALALRYVYAFIWGPDRLSIPADNDAFVSFAGVNLRFWDLMGSIIAIVLLVLVALFFSFTRLGKATRAVADNKALAAATGINVERVIRIVWVGGGALAGVSGALIGYYQTLQWNAGALILLLLFASVTLGGFGSIWGSLLGALIIGLAMDVSTLWVPTSLKYVVAMLIMIVVLLVRPQGLLGKKQRIG
ncbi:Branched-chain amino acid ABC transporter,permease protein [Acidipropionibacterium acidipropionici ATCC 4875]|uniref:Branched-chain amino acid ABC transporter,permease protein n=1 Tax=Acidipropionibacterium acidipropionici (strain ATCC 4875 / DSM 20272 / JCM 6432 / NBRC 12425 / NCIMB 8070 / 4) TaxID=1171373 RepID=K7RZL0_ACIA4|nr:Branched-chain amino acid ABC transporter,permease protein [Acidipropionibacterium acidipropionici]AFV90473.1 Branched-chain amino acid ABC transporter,permease protein [Acidipropionibacterium acidipropionici ATCC 4875]